MGIRPKLEPKSIGPGPGKFHLENKSRFGEKYYQTYIGQRLIDLSKLFKQQNIILTEICYVLMAILIVRESINAWTGQVQINGFNRCGAHEIL